MSKDNSKIVVSDVSFEWDREKGHLLVAGAPVVCMWVETTMAGFMGGIQKMVGAERLDIVLQSAGKESVEAEWKAFVAPTVSLEEGLAQLGRSAEQMGFGRWEITSLDYEKKEARFRGKNGWEGLYQRALGVCWGSSSLAGKLSGYCDKLFGVDCAAEQTSFIAKGDEYDEFIVRPAQESLEAQYHSLTASDTATRADLTAALETLQKEVQERRQAEAATAELSSTLESLQNEVTQRKLVEQELRAKLMIIRRQEEAIRAMATPILQIWDGVLAMPVVGLVDSMRAAQMMESLLNEISKTHVRFTILDLTGVDVIDTSAANHILKLVRGAGLMGTRCIISGIAPSMANTIVGLGIDLNELQTFNTLEKALRYAIQETEEQEEEPPAD